MIKLQIDTLSGNYMLLLGWSLAVAEGGLVNHSLHLFVRAGKQGCPAQVFPE